MQVAALALVYSREGNHSAGRTTVLNRDPAIPSEVRVARMSHSEAAEGTAAGDMRVHPGYRGAVCAKLASDRIERGAARPGYSHGLFKMTRAEIRASFTRPTP